MSVLCVVGARPNFMKVAPILRALDEAGVPRTLVHTGQHYDDALSGVFFRDLELPDPDVHLGVGSGTHAEQTAKVMLAFEPVVAEVQPRAVVVVGDVNSTLACALVAQKRGVPLAHVEAGLRSGDRTMPEEINRILTDQLSDLCLTPSRDADENLLREGVAEHRVCRVGNVMIDALRAALPRARARADDVLSRFEVAPRGYALATLHRPSNVDGLEALARMIDTLGRVARHLPVVFPAHPRTRASLERSGLKMAEGVRLVAPLGYLECVAMEANAALVLTDSGGMQEETTFLRVPCLTLREQTERPVTVHEGTNRVVGTDPDVVIEAVRHILGDARPKAARCPQLWDGMTAGRIVDEIAARFLGRKDAGATARTSYGYIAGNLTAGTSSGAL